MMSSVICNIIKEHKNDWRVFFEEEYPDITIKEEAPYAMFVYSIKSDFKDPVVQESRGIIINTEVPEVACFPFRKFGKSYDNYVDKIDWKNVRIEEKIDGSLVKLWFDKLSCKWRFSSNRMINLDDCFMDQYSGTTLMDILVQASGYDVILNEILNTDSVVLNKNKTYMFELISPENTVVIKHKGYSLYHIGTRDNRTGIEERQYIGIKRPDYYPMHTLEECDDFVREVDKNHDTGKYDDCSFEGLVAVDENWNRMKIKSPMYTMLHNIVSSSDKSKNILLKMLWNDEIDISVMCKRYPELSHYLKYYDFKVTEFRHQAESFIDICRKIHDLFNGNRRYTADIIKQHPFSKLGFLAIGNDKSLNTIMSETRDPLKILDSYIKDYSPSRMGYLLSHAYELKKNIENK